MKKILGKFTYLDLIIIVIVFSAIIMAFYNTADSQYNIQKYTFDSMEMEKANLKFQDLYGSGKIVYSRLSGYNSIDGKKETIYGEVLWSNEKEMLLNVNGSKILASNYQNRFADFYFESITLEVVGYENNTVDVILEPINITSVNELIFDIPEEYRISAYLTVTPQESSLLQKLDNELYLRENYSPVSTADNNDILNLTWANSTDLKIIDEVIGDLDGVSSYITIRIFNVSDDTLEKLKNEYKIKKIVRLPN
ncbi:MAG: hypothetical protein ACP5C3_07495 [Methanomicrobiales archaeon]